MTTEKSTKPEFKDDDDYKKALYDIMGKSQDDFERQLSFISAGALGLSMLFTEKIVKDISKADCKSLLVAGWVFLAITLFINLVSHLLATLNCRKTIQEYHEKNPGYRLNARRRTGHMLIVNWITLSFLVLGILAIIIFTALNT